jgi:hypothetical protein
MPARVGAPFSGFSYFEHLALAALFRIGGVVFRGGVPGRPDALPAIASGLSPMDRKLPYLI